MQVESILGFAQIDTVFDTGDKLYYFIFTIELKKILPNEIIGFFFIWEKAFCSTVEQATGC